MATPKRYESKDGTVSWRVRFRIGNGSRSETFATKKQADKFCQLVKAVGGARARAIINETDANEVLGYVFGDVAEQWLEWKGAKRKNGDLVHVRSSYTIDRYGQLLRNQILPTFADHPLNLVDEGMVQDWIDTLAEELSPKTVKDAHAVLHQIYKWAGSKSRGIAINDPCTETVLPRRRKGRVKGLLPAEWTILHEAAREVDGDAADLLMFLVYSGWRWSEAVAVRAIDVDDFEDRGVFVTMGRVMRRGAGGRIEIVDDEAKSEAGFRRIKMTPASAEMIRRRLKELKPHDLLFTNPQGRKWYYKGFIERFWQRPAKGRRDPSPKRGRILETAKAKGLDRKVELHMLRHTHAVLLLTSGESHERVQKRLGHEDITTTVGTYGSLIGDVSDESLDALDAILAGKKKLTGLKEIEATPPDGEVES